MPRPEACEVFMKWQLVYHNNESLGEQWRLRFDGQVDVEVLPGDICQVQADAIVSPANSFGFMDGGLDQALSERFGWGLQESLQRAIVERPLK
jgi:hypothetical protein